MNDFVNMNVTELETILSHTTTLARHASFVADGDLSKDSGVDDQSIEQAKKAAQDYARARNNKARSRSYLSGEDVSDGVASALDWLKRKRKSALKE
jgi:uncharacterized protein YaaQ